MLPSQIIKTSIMTTLGCWMILGTTTDLRGGVLGIAGEDAGNQALVFEARSGAILGTVPLGPGAVGDCVVTPDQSLGLMVDYASNLWFIDLEAQPPVLATGTNPVLLSSLGQDVDLSPDGRFALVCGGTDFVSVVDLEARNESDTFDLGHGCQSVEACTDGSVLVSWMSIPDNGRLVRRLQLNGMGQLTDTGESFTPDFPTNVYCGPGSQIALVTQIGWDVTTLSLSGLAALDQETLSGAVSTAVFHRGQDRVTFRVEEAIEAYDLDPVSGALGTTPSLTISNTGSFVPLGGIETLALDEPSGLLFAPSNESIFIYDALDGTPQAPVFKEGADFTGVCLGPSSIFEDGFESGDLEAWSNSSP